MEFRRTASSHNRPFPSRARLGTTLPGVADDSEDGPGNAYEQFLFDLAKGPVPLGRIFLVWIALVVGVLVVISLASELTDAAFGIVGAAVSIPYFFVLCPLWASRLGRKREDAARS